MCEFEGHFCPKAPFCRIFQGLKLENLQKMLFLQKKPYDTFSFSYFGKIRILGGFWACSFHIMTYRKFFLCK